MCGASPSARCSILTGCVRNLRSMWVSLLVLLFQRPAPDRMKRVSLGLHELFAIRCAMRRADRGKGLEDFLVDQTSDAAASRPIQRVRALHFKERAFLGRVILASPHQADRAWVLAAAADVHEFREVD